MKWIIIFKYFKYLNYKRYNEWFYYTIFIIKQWKNAIILIKYKVKLIKNRYFKRIFLNLLNFFKLSTSKLLINYRVN